LNKVPKLTRGLKNETEKQKTQSWEAAPFVVASIGLASVDSSALSPFLPAIHNPKQNNNSIT
jgi:hypothetical protein